MNSYDTIGNIIKEINLITEYEMYDIICDCNKTGGCPICNAILRGNINWYPIERRWNKWKF